MKKIKKTVWWIIIIAIIAIVICSNISLGTTSPSAEDFHTLQAPKPTGTTYTLSGYDAMVSYWNVYCTQYWERLEWDTDVWEYYHKVEIRGQTARFYDPDGNYLRFLYK